MANQKWPAHVPKPKDDADRRCTGPLFQNWRLPIDRFERTRNNVVVFATGRDVCRSQGAFARQGWSGPVEKAPPQLRGWFGLRDQFVRAPDQKTLRYMSGDETFLFRF